MSFLALARRTLLPAGLCITLSNAATATPNDGAGHTRPKAAPSTTPAFWLLHPRSSTSATMDPALNERDALFQGIRLSRSATGAVRRSNDFINGSNTKALRVPASWGGGYVFHSDIEANTALWYASSWLSPLSPLGHFGERVDRVTLGFGRIYAHLGDSGQTVALDFSGAHQTDLGPIPRAPGYFDLRFWDDWFAAANTDVRGVLVTFDAGATWHPTGITDEAATFSVEEDGIGIRTGGAHLTLQPTGVWRSDDEVGQYSREEQGDAPFETLDALLAISDVEQPLLPLHPLGNDPLREAVLHGWAMTPTSAVVATAGAVGVVDLVSGQTRRVRKSQYPGYKSCHAAALGQRIAMVCPLAHDAVGIYRLEPDLSLALLKRWPHPTSISSSAGALLVHAACPNTAPSNDRHVKPGALEKHLCLVGANAVHDFVLPPSQRERRLVALPGDRLAVVAPPTSHTAGSLTTLRRGQASASPSIQLRFTPKVDSKTRDFVATGFWLKDASALADGRLGFWVAHGNRLIGVVVAPDGIITVGRRTETDVRRTHVSGARAFELTSGEIAYQTVDYGQTWSEVDMPRGLTAAATRNTSDEVGCSNVGCAFGAWLRVGYSLSGESEIELSQPDSSDVIAARSLSRVPTEAPTPAEIHHRPSAYPQWHFNCYPSGTFESAATGSASATFAAGQAAARLGGKHGFGNPVANVNSHEPDLAPSAHRHFLGVKHPELPRGNLAFDMGQDGERQFRAYVWGPPDATWSSNSTWVVRVADRFSVAGLWSSAPTLAPWPDVLSAARLFGADRTNQHSSSWELALDPSERGGILRINTAGTTELHVVEANGTTASMGGQSMGSIAGAVKINGAWHFGTQDRNKFHVYQLRQGVPLMVRSYPVSDFVHVTLLRNHTSTRLALLLRAPAGTWHIYPLRADFEPDAPVVLDRDMLNQQWPKCGDEDEGWVVVSELPPSRFTPSSGAEMLTLQTETDELNAEAVLARSLVNASHPCVEALAARLTSERAPTPERRRLPPTANTIPLTLTDRANDVRHGYRCAQ